MRATPEQTEHGRRATERARAVLRPGDVVVAAMCAGLHRRFKMTGWQGDWICGRTVSDCHALHVVRVCGVPTSFRDPA